MKTQREGRQRGATSFQAIANQLHGLGVEINPSALFKYETLHRMPDADVLWGLGQLYGASFDWLVRMALGQRHSSRVEKAPKGGRHAAAPTGPLLNTREAALQEELAEARATAEHFRTIVAGLTESVTLFADQVQNTLSQLPAPKRAPCT